jgi:hypothetical protein
MIILAYAGIVPRGTKGGPRNGPLIALMDSAEMLVVVTG